MAARVSAAGAWVKRKAMNLPVIQDEEDLSSAGGSRISKAAP